jgi:hypothetical protein
MILTLGSLVIDRSIRPSLIPRAEIEALADELMRRQPDDPEGAAFAAECAAWYRSENSRKASGGGCVVRSADVFGRQPLAATLEGLFTRSACG